ncbi:MAG: SMC-Scp complex subunit ScpB [Planctomycetes bacterium]|nr:SMC-Scp complex subunit ScpB [Planctomycetota bacterium]
MENEDAAEQAESQQSPESVSDIDVSAVESILFATDTPLSAAKIAEVACLDGGRMAARQAVDRLNERYEQMVCSFRIESLAGGYQMLTLPEFNDVLSRLLKARSESKLSQAGLETLAIIAYKQPILRANVEGIRGVSAGEVIRNLMEKGLVKIIGRAEEIGRPMLYGTTRKFLEVFGLADLKDLPQVPELASGATADKPACKSDSRMGEVASSSETVESLEGDS